MDVAQARTNMLGNISSIKAVPKYINQNTGNLYRRQTFSEKNHGAGGFWVMYEWGLTGFELHVHYNAAGKINADHIKVAGSNMKGGQVFIDSAQLNLIRQKIQPPAK